MGAGLDDAGELTRDGARMQSSLSHRRAKWEFAEAVHAFTEDPGPANLERYLAASKALEKSYGAPAVRRTDLAPTLR